MTERLAMFTPDGDDYRPINKAAVAACAVMSKMKLSKLDIVTIKSKGFWTVLPDGKPICEVNIFV